MADHELAAVFSSRVRQRIDELGRTRASIAASAGITRECLYLLERGKKLPRWPTVVALSTTLGVSLDWLAGREPLWTE